ncbi:hypothetical protein ERY430_40562 [Erythrobacter sp. EC-HK427]|nr:hypothetical protein ERY430_40562 [Erythrobacter sp. EC-HK427]
MASALAAHKTGVVNGSTGLAITLMAEPAMHAAQALKRPTGSRSGRSERPVVNHDEDHESDEQKGKEEQSRTSPRIGPGFLQL